MKIAALNLVLAAHLMTCGCAHEEMITPVVGGKAVILENLQRQGVSLNETDNLASPVSVPVGHPGCEKAIYGQVVNDVLEVEIDGVVHPSFKWKLEDIDPDILEFPLKDLSVHEVCFVDESVELCGTFSNSKAAKFAIFHGEKQYNVLVKGLLPPAKQ